MPRRNDPSDDAFPWDQEPASGLGKTRFHDPAQAEPALKLIRRPAFDAERTWRRVHLLADAYEMSP